MSINAALQASCNGMSDGDAGFPSVSIIFGGERSLNAERASLPCLFFSRKCLKTPCFPAFLAVFRCPVPSLCGSERRWERPPEKGDTTGLRGRSVVRTGRTITGEGGSTSEQQTYRAHGKGSHATRAERHAVRTERAASATAQGGWQSGMQRPVSVPFMCRPGSFIAGYSVHYSAASGVRGSGLLGDKYGKALFQ